MSESSLPRAYRILIISWAACLTATSGKDWIQILGETSAEEDLCLGQQLMLAWALEKGWRPD